MSLAAIHPLDAPEQAAQITCISQGVTEAMFKMKAVNPIEVYTP